MGRRATRDSRPAGSASPRAVRSEWTTASCSGRSPVQLVAVSRVSTSTPASSRASRRYRPVVARAQPGPPGAGAQGDASRGGAAARGPAAWRAPASMRIAVPPDDQQAAVLVPAQAQVGAAQALAGATARGHRHADARLLAIAQPGDVGGARSWASLRKRGDPVPDGREGPAFVARVRRAGAAPSR